MDFRIGKSRLPIQRRVPAIGSQIENDPNVPRWRKTIPCIAIRERPACLPLGVTIDQWNRDARSKRGLDQRIRSPMHWKTQPLRVVGRYHRPSIRDPAIEDRFQELEHT